jgi:hypothetical protein
VSTHSRKATAIVIITAFLVTQCEFGLASQDSYLRLETPDEAPATGAELANALGAPEDASAPPPPQAKPGLGVALELLRMLRGENQNTQPLNLWRQNYPNA